MAVRDSSGCRALPVSGAVHGLEGVGFLLHLEGEHVLAVVLPVAGGLPQLAVVNVGRDYFLEAPLLVLTLPMVEKGVLFNKINGRDVQVFYEIFLTSCPGPDFTWTTLKYNRVHLRNLSRPLLQSEMKSELTTVVHDLSSYPLLNKE